MHCRTCDYPLWNLKARQCPECGTAFKPGEYEFVPNTVRFCCAQCDQSYYGTGVKGHLVPHEFNCVKCGVRMSMDDAVLRPAAGVEEEQTRVARVPWLERRERGFVRAFFGTVGLVLVNQSRLVRGLAPQPKPGAAWWFAVVALVAIALTAVTPLMLFMVPALMVGRTTAGMMSGVGVFSTFAGVIIAGSLAFLFVWALTAHGILRITGPMKGGFGRTMEAFGYSAGANVITAVPCFGFYFGWIWWMISATLLVKEAQGVSGGRAALATLPQPLLFVGGMVTLFAILVTQAGTPNMTTVTTPGGVVTLPGQVSVSQQSYEMQQVIGALIGHHAQFGAMPKHALELVANHDLMASDLIMLDSKTSTADIPVDSSTLAAFERLSVVERQQTVDAAIAGLPSDAIAHRLGDFVFTYHGVTLNADGRLWLVAMCADPAVNPGAGSGDLVVGLADGSVMEFPAGEVERALLLQNATRTVFGLPLLPDPRGIGHGNAESKPESEATDVSP